MEISVLRYFLEIARKGSMTAAAEVLHVSQSALSKQMKELEDELGKKLFRRGSRSMSLTEEGILLRRRTEDILDMVDKTTEEFRAIDDLQGGDVYLGCAESHLIAHIARKIKHFKERYPLFHYHIISGDRTVVLDRLDRGLLDFGVVVEMPDIDRYQYLELPGVDRWGVIMPKDHPLAKKRSRPCGRPVRRGTDLLGAIGGGRHPALVRKESRSAEFYRKHESCLQRKRFCRGRTGLDAVL